jgi:hypothetical protein
MLTVDAKKRSFMSVLTVYVIFRTHFNILLVRYVNISVVALYCCLGVTVRTHVFLISITTLIYIYIYIPHDDGTA